MEIRYWYQFEGTNQAEQTYIDYAGRSGTDIGSYTNATIIAGSFGDNQDRYFKITFDSGAGSLGSGHDDYLETQARFNKNDWSNYDQSDDYSYVNYVDYTEWDKVTVYINGNKVWGTEPGEVGSSKLPEDTQTPVFYEILDSSNVFNYPNPCKGETTIRFSLAKQKNVSLIIYNIQGKIIREKQLTSAEARPGVNRIEWKGDNKRGMPASNGIYLLKVITEDKIITKKIAVIR